MNERAEVKDVKTSDYLRRPVALLLNHTVQKKLRACSTVFRTPHKYAHSRATDDKTGYGNIAGCPSEINMIKVGKAVPVAIELLYKRCAQIHIQSQHQKLSTANASWGPV